MNWLNQIGFRVKMAIPVGITIFVFVAILSIVYPAFNTQNRINHILINEIQPVLNDF